jgi:hypothetical protein
MKNKSAHEAPGIGGRHSLEQNTLILSSPISPQWQFSQSATVAAHLMSK